MGISSSRLSIHLKDFLYTALYARPCASMYVTGITLKESFAQCFPFDEYSHISGNLMNPGSIFLLMLRGYFGNSEPSTRRKYYFGYFSKKLQFCEKMCGSTGSAASIGGVSIVIYSSVRTVSYMLRYYNRR